MKRLSTILILLCLVLTFSVYAAQPPKIVDSAGLLTQSQVEDLEQKAQALCDTYRMDVVIVTVESLGGKSAEAYADDYFDYNGYGIGDDYSGILLLLAMDTRQWAMSTCGDTIYAVTDYGIQSIFAQISTALSQDHYYDAFAKYLTELERYFKAYESNDPIDGIVGGYDGPGFYYPGTQDDVVHYEEPLTVGDYVMRVLVALLIGAAAGGIALLIMRGQMNTARAQSGAKDYMIPGSYQLYRHQDLFLYSRTSRMRKPDSNSGGGGSRGGSSIHRSSSGRSHGGGHGRF